MKILMNDQERSQMLQDQVNKQLTTSKRTYQFTKVLIIIFGIITAGILFFSCEQKQEQQNPDNSIGVKFQRGELVGNPFGRFSEAVVSHQYSPTVDYDVNIWDATLTDYEPAQVALPDFFNNTYDLLPGNYTMDIIVNTNDYNVNEYLTVFGNGIPFQVRTTTVSPIPINVQTNQCMFVIDSEDVTTLPHWSTNTYGFGDVGAGDVSNYTRDFYNRGDIVTPEADGFYYIYVNVDKAPETLGILLETDTRFLEYRFDKANLTKGYYYHIKVQPESAMTMSFEFNDPFTTVEVVDVAFIESYK